MSRYLNLLFILLMIPILYVYERWIMYKIRESWGIVHAMRIKNKGRNTKLSGYSRYLGVNNLVLGDNVRIGYGCFFYCSGGIEIKSHTIISRNVTIYSSNHDIYGDAIPYDSSLVNKPVVIGEGVWVGMGVKIVPGVTIGDGAVIGMGAVVSSSVAAGEIVVGARQRVISRRDMEAFIKHKNQNSIYSVLWPEK